MFLSSGAEDVASKLAKPVTFPPGRSSRATMPLATGSLHKDDRDRLRFRLEGNGPRELGQNGFQVDCGVKFK